MQSNARALRPQRAWNYTNIFLISLIHALAGLAIPCFSWDGLALSLFGLFVLAPLGINVGYHRMLTHGSFQAPSWLRYSLITLGAIVGAGPPIRWAAMHRLHHRFSDTAEDPHNSHCGFWYSHIFHLFYVDEREVGAEGEMYLRKYAPDLVKDKYLQFVSRYWIGMSLATLPLLYMWGGFGYVVWGGFVRLVITWHTMWLVNSASHIWGYRNYITRDNTMNCWPVGLLAAGEGWHNNHHADPASAAHGHKWWEFDFSFWIIRSFEFAGLATNVRRPQAVRSRNS